MDSCYYLNVCHARGLSLVIFQCLPAPPPLFTAFLYCVSICACPSEAPASQSVTDGTSQEAETDTSRVDAFTEANKKWRESHCGVGEMSCWPPAKTGLFNLPAAHSGKVERFPVWWYLTCCYCLSLAALWANNRAPRTIRMRQALPMPPLSSVTFISQAGVKIKAFLNYSGTPFELRSHHKNGRQQQSKLQACVHTSKHTVSECCWHLFSEKKQRGKTCFKIIYGPQWRRSLWLKVFYKYLITDNQRVAGTCIINVPLNCGVSVLWGLPF